MTHHARDSEFKHWRHGDMDLAGYMSIPTELSKKTK